ncbi:hypothetical protein PGO22_02300 [Klebsiella aerogenes]
MGGWESIEMVRRYAHRRLTIQRNQHGKLTQFLRKLSQICPTKKNQRLGGS